MIDAARAAKGGELVAVFRDALALGRPGGRGEVEARETGGDVGGVVRAGGGVVVAKLLQRVVGRVG